VQKSIDKGSIAVLPDFSKGARNPLEVAQKVAQHFRNEIGRRAFEKTVNQ